MHILRATYRIVTPMYIAGADQEAAEFRVPSFKGALRFWWRAIEWPKIIRDGKDPQKAFACLVNREENLFGSVNGRSKVMVRCLGAPAASKAPLDPHRYGGYGLSDRKALLTGELVIELRAGEGDRLDRVEPALKLLGLCGGLGSRSRNGYGSLTLIDIHRDGEKSNEWGLPSSADDFKAVIVKLLAA